MTGTAGPLADGVVTGHVMQPVKKEKTMALVNENYLKLPGSYLFSDIAREIQSFKKINPEVRLINLGIGDVTKPLPEACVKAMHKAVDEMSNAATFRGYGPGQGYDFLINAIIRNNYQSRGVSLDKSEIFISDGSKSDTGNFCDILSTDNSVGLTDPIYPVYVDSNVIDGRAGDIGRDGRWSNITYMPCTAENNFLPRIPGHRVDIIYLCYPNNPTGTVLTREQLKEWVDYALANDTLILYDSAYEAFIRDKNIPHTIYEIKNAKKCAVEFRSFSKIAVFTGVRCAYTVVPHEVSGALSDDSRTSLNKLWSRRQSTKFNGTSYITQRGAEAIFTPEGKKQVRKIIDYYLENARIMRDGMQDAGLTVYGGVNAPYIWLKTPEGKTSWKFFEYLLHRAHVIETPGSGFGPSGEGYLRLTAFGERYDCIEAMERIRRNFNR